MSEYSEMMAAHDAREDGVYLVQVYEKEKFIQHGIFNKSQMALDWIHTLPSEYTCTCIPFIMNHPDAGMVEKGAMQ